MVIVLDFGGQYNQLIARRVRECNVYCEVMPHTTSLDLIREKNPKGIIFTGGPASVYKEDSPTISPEIFSMGIPILGICYGAQLMQYLLGGKVKTANVREYGRTEVEVDVNTTLFEGVSEKTIVWMSHTDHISEPAEGFVVTSSSKDCPVAAVENKEKNLYAVQFHPEESLCRAVPSRSNAFCRRNKDAFQLFIQSMSLRRRLENGFLRRILHSGNS